MPVHITRPFEGGVSVESLIRRLTNAARSRRKQKRKEAEKQKSEISVEKHSEVENVNNVITNAVGDSIETPPSGQEDPTQLNDEGGQTSKQSNGSPSTHTYSTEENQTAAVIKHDELNGPIAQADHEAHADNSDSAVEGPGVHIEPVPLNDPSIRSPSSIQLEMAGKYGSDEDPSSGSTSASSVVSSGYIPPPVTRSPGGTQIWTIRDWQAGRHPNDCDLEQLSPDAQQLARTDTRKFNSSASESDCKNGDAAADNDISTKGPLRSIDDMNIKFDLQLSLDPMLRAALMVNGKELAGSSTFGCELQSAESNYGLILGTKRNNNSESNSFWNRFEIPGLIGIVSIASLTVGFTLGVAIRRYR